MCVCMCMCVCVCVCVCECVYVCVYVCCVCVYVVRLCVYRCAHVQYIDIYKHLHTSHVYFSKRMLMSACSQHCPRQCEARTQIHNTHTLHASEWTHSNVWPVGRFVAASTVAAEVRWDTASFATMFHCIIPRSFRAHVGQLRLATGSSVVRARHRIAEHARAAGNGPALWVHACTLYWREQKFGQCLDGALRGR